MKLYNFIVKAGLIAIIGLDIKLFIDWDKESKAHKEYYETLTKVEKKKADIPEEEPSKKNAESERVPVRTVNFKSVNSAQRALDALKNEVSKRGKLHLCTANMIIFNSVPYEESAGKWDWIITHHDLHNWTASNIYGWKSLDSAILRKDALGYFIEFPPLQIV